MQSPRHPISRPSDGRDETNVCRGPPSREPGPSGPAAAIVPGAPGLMTASRPPGKRINPKALIDSNSVKKTLTADRRNTLRNSALRRQCQRLSHRMSRQRLAEADDLPLEGNAGLRLDAGTHRLAQPFDILAAGVLVGAARRAAGLTRHARRFGDAVRNIIHRVKAGHVEALQEINRMTFALGKQRNQNIRAGHFFAA